MVAILEPYEVWEGRIPNRKNAVSRSLWKTSGCSLLSLLRLDLFSVPLTAFRPALVLDLSWATQDEAVDSDEPAPLEI